MYGPTSMAGPTRAPVVRSSSLSASRASWRVAKAFRTTVADGVEAQKLADAATVSWQGGGKVVPL